MGNRTSAIGGINGGFFDVNNGCAPLGLLKIDNKVISYAVSTRPPRSALGIQADKTILFRRTDSKDSFPEAIHALGGMPNLVKDGQKYVTTSEEQADSIAGVNPRTAICKTSNNHFLMITVDGRAPNKTGMNLDDLAQYLLWLGCSDGINLDGGGSTTMWISGKSVVNNPSDGTERYVSNGLFVFYTDNLPPQIEHTPITESEKKDITISAKVTDDYNLKAVNLKFRNIGETDFTSRSMVNKGNDIYEATILANDIKDSKIQYYIAAWDGSLRTLLPADAESANNYFEISIKYIADAGEEDSFEDIKDSNDVINDVYNDVYDINDVYETLNDSISEDITILDSTTTDDIIAEDTITYDIYNEDIISNIDIIYLTDDMNIFEDTYEINDNFIFEITDLYDARTLELSEENDLTSDINNSQSGCSCTFVE
jgi:hypothetical protein